MERKTGADASPDGFCQRLPEEETGPRSRCLTCGRQGRDVDPLTVKSLLRSRALARRSEPSHRFCPTSDCPVVYFGNEERFVLEDVRVGVFQKETSPDRIVCYCFGVSEASIREEIARTGSSTALQRIRELVEADRCVCELRNPQGSCCLGNVAATERAAAECAPRPDAEEGAAAR